MGSVRQGGNTIMKQKILIDYPVPEECWAPLAEEFDVTVSTEAVTREELLESIGEYDGLFNYIQRIDTEVFERGKNLTVVGNNGVGYDNVDVKAATERGIPIVYTPNEVTEATAEHTCALIVSVMRNVARFDREIRNHVWNAPIFPTLPTQVEGSVLGILGFGRIGKRVCKKMQGMGMEVIYYDAFRASPEVEAEYGVTYKSFDEVVAEADCLTLHMPFTPENHHIINADVFAKMKPEAYLVNAARGPIVDEEALYEALVSGQIKGAGLDVFENEPHPLEKLLTLDNITMTPHVASGTWKTRVGMANEGLSGVAAVLRGEKPYNVVNQEVL